MSLQPGDLVTAAGAPEGAPSWVGEVVDECLECARDACVRVARLGGETPNRVFDGQHVGVAWLRPLTNAEAVGLAEALTWERWRPFGTSGCLALFPDGGVIVLAALRGEWSVTAPIGGGRLGRFAGGKAGTQDDGMAAASRALIAYTIRGKV